MTEPRKQMDMIWHQDVDSYPSFHRDALRKS
jgi:hypothetical protein